MDIDDEHYKKYIKYKTKYLELKEHSGGGNFFKFLFNIFKSKNKTEETSSPSLKNIDVKNNIQLFISDISKDKVKVKDKIKKIEDNLLNVLLIELMDNKLAVDIYKQICNTILNYQEYFYLNVNNLNIKTQNIINSKKSKNKKKIPYITIDVLQINCIENILVAQEKINNLIYKLPNLKDLKKLITIYFNYVYESIDNNIYSIVRIIEFKQNNIFNIISNEISDSNITNKIKALPDPKENSPQFMKELYNIQKLLKLKVLLHNIGDNTNNSIMLINCYFYAFKLKLSLFKQVSINHADFYFDRINLTGGNDFVIIVDKNIIINILNTLIQIIIFFSKFKDTNEFHIKNTNNYTLEYKNEKYTLSMDVAKQLIDVIIKDIQIYLPNLFEELQKYIDLNIELQL